MALQLRPAGGHEKIQYPINKSDRVNGPQPAIRSRGFAYCFMTAFKNLFKKGPLLHRPCHDALSYIRSNGPC